jgi:hypothetical protein
MTKLELGAVVLLAVASCTSHSAPSAKLVDPVGTWDLTMIFTTTNCTGLPATYPVSFDVAASGSDTFAFNPGTGLSGDSIAANTTCSGSSCVVAFMDQGPGGEGSDLMMQNIMAVLDEDDTGSVATDSTATNLVTLVFDDNSMCASQFTATGDVTN